MTREATRNGLAYERIAAAARALAGAKAKAAAEQLTITITIINEETPMKNFSPIVGFRVRQWFSHWAVEAVRSDGSTERFNVADSLPGAQAKLAQRAHN